MLALKTISTLSALVFTAVNIHMQLQRILSLETLLTLTAWIQLSRSMYLFVTIQTLFCRKPFVTHCTQMQGRSRRSGWSGFNRTTFWPNRNFFSCQSI